ncbi:hypothetical protein OG874_41250 [Nocardia sp. NBC_00565]|uniref:hypothetical protein n=1 Tax=Nocardia sp. NBC_00565 TaxID=2975993 RepID=UPI002E81D5C0|nr:hypothetical protein [Nocardia sp. NBC_00565]WUC03044.1 hypothetical protein OG874_41250 [Nocardia sp. NBC_00565]
MGSVGDGKDNESDQSGSEFGPPLDDFGPPVSEFGPPVGEFGPPTGDFGPPTGDFGPPTGGQVRPQWAVPEPATDHPELIWRPADEPPSVPPPPPQYRAPDSTVFGDAPPPPPPPTRRPQPPVEPDPTEATVRHTTPPPAQRETWWNSPTESGGVPTPPPEPPGLSWADDPIAKRLAPKLLSDEIAATPSRSGSRGRWIALGVLAAVVVALALVVTFVAVSRDDNTSPKAAPPPPPSTSAALSCPASKDGRVTRGNGQGDTSSGAGAILGFQYEFYVDRNGEKARKYVAPDAENVSTAEIIQQAINDQIPVGSTHCLRVAEVAGDTFEVDLTEHRPDGTTNVYRQTVTTVDRDGKTVIFAIRERI